MEKLAFKGNLAYIDFQVRNMNVKLHPENYKIMKEVEFLVQNNLPVPRDKLYIIMPEIFAYDVEDMTEIEQKNINKNRLLLGYVF